jgi:hypothetical protein
VIARRVPRPALLRTRRAAWGAAVAAAAVLVTIGGLLGYGVTVLTTPDPGPAVAAAEPGAHDVAPACQEIAPAVQNERATDGKLAAAHEHSVAQSEVYGDAVLSTAPDAIKKEAKALDEALRAEQQLELDVAIARAATDTAVTDCTTEAP